MNCYDLVFVGHESTYEVDAPEGSARGLPGGAASFGALAARWSKKKIAVITRMAQEDAPTLEPLKTDGIDVYLQLAAATTHLRIVHPTGNLDERLIVQTQNAGFFESADVPPIEPCWIHLAALTDREFRLEFMWQLKQRGFRLSVDMQGFAAPGLRGRVFPESSSTLRTERICRASFQIPDADFYPRCSFEE
jgi:hypothetical protein